MDLTQLEHFLAVAEERTFTRAAERVCRTQPAVSQSIRRLEEEIGMPLFARDIHDVSLTEAGRMLVDYARRMVRTRNEALNELDGLKRLTSGTLKIAAHESAAVYLLPPPLRHYFQSFPNIQICIYRSRLPDIPRQVLDRDVHVGFVKEEPPFHELQAVEVYRDEMVLVAWPGHPLAHRTDARLRDFADDRFVLHRDERHASSPTEQMIVGLFAQHGMPCRIVAEVWSFENLKNFVQAEIGLAIVPKMTVEQELQTGRLVWIKIPELNIPRRTLMIYQEHGYLSDVARELIKIVRSFNWEQFACSRRDSADGGGRRPMPKLPRHGTG